MAAASSDKFVSSFQRKGRRKVIQITGTRPSLHNGQLLLSSGIPSLDHILGGGVAVGTVLLIEEDLYSSFARLLLKYFVAEGVMCGHYSFLSSLDYNLNKLLTELPCPVENTPSVAQNLSLSSISDNTAGRMNLEDTKSLPPQQRSNVATTANSESIAAPERNMEIAWRYQNMPPVKTEMATSCNIFGHTYDLTKTMSAEKIDQDKLWYYHPPKILDKSFQNSKFDDLFGEIQGVIEKSGCNLQAPKATNYSKNIMRLALLSLGSPLWGESGTTAEENSSLCHFLHRIRATIRKSLAVCIVTIPTHLFQTMYTRRIERLCDYVVRLESFAGEEKSAAFKEYHGLFHVVRIPRLNCLANYAVDNDDLAFKLKRKKFSIEKIHLPPDLSETVSRSQGEHLKTMKGCAELNKNPTQLDF